MRICQIVPELNLGGVETGTVDLSKALRAQGHEVFVISNGGLLVRQLEEAGVSHVFMSVHRKELFAILYCAWRVRRLVRDHGIDIVHARSRVPGWIAYLATRGTRAKFVTTAHGAYTPHPGSRVMGWGRRVIVPSRTIWERMHTEFDVPQERLRLVPRGVDLERFGGGLPPRNISSSGPVVAGVVGRITPLKGHEVFLQALALARQREPRLIGKIVGDSPAQRQEVKDNLVVLARRLGLGQGVCFQEAQEDVQKVYTGLDILVMPSVQPESFGRVIVEAQASGIPVVASALGGALDIIEDGRSGRLFPAGDVQALANILCELVQNPQRTRRLSNAGRQEVLSQYVLPAMVFRTLEVYREVLDPKKILVLKFGSVGDVLLAEPSLRALRKRFPRAHLAVLVKKAYRDALATCPHLDELIEYDNEGLHRGPNILCLAEELRQRGFDLSVDIQNNWRSHALAFCAGIPWRLGYARKAGWFFLNDPMPEPAQKMDPVSHQFSLLRRLDIAVESDERPLQYLCDGKDEAWADKFLRQAGVEQDGNLTAIHVGGSSRWKSKQWGLDSFAALINSLQAKSGMQPLLVGGPSDLTLWNGLRPLLRRPCINAMGKTSLGQLAALLRRCRVLVGADSAPLHLACALKVPFVALFGPTDPGRHAPCGNGKVLFKNPPCGPCYEPVCPEGHHRCMKDISLSEVMDAIISVTQHREDRVSSAQAVQA